MYFKIFISMIDEFNLKVSFIIRIIIKIAINYTYTIRKTNIIFKSK